jgi:hypothetical protein
MVMFVTNLSSRIIARICNLIMWFVFLQRKKKFEIHTHKSIYGITSFSSKTLTSALWVKTGVDTNVWVWWYLKPITHEFALNPSFWLKHDFYASVNFT